MSPLPKKIRCYQCRMHLDLCFCSHIHPLNLKTKVIVLMHWREFHLITNTGVLAHKVLTNSEIRFRGRPDKNPTELKDLLDPKYNAHVLYPISTAKTLDEKFLEKQTQPLTLIALDGNWGQASRMIKREPVLKHLPKVKLPIGLESNYHLRRNPIAGNVCTFEAIARSLGILESPHVQFQMETVFNKMVSRHLFNRGKIAKTQIIS